MKVLVISAHPDDETLGCGGTLLKHSLQGDSIFWVIATQAHAPKWSEKTIVLKKEEVVQVVEAYGIKKYFLLGFPAAGLDITPMSTLIAALHAAILEVRPQIIYMIHNGDAHTDHQLVFTAAMSVLKPFYMSKLGVSRILCYETMSSTEAAPPVLARAFLPNVFSDITPYINKKIEVMKLYTTEIQPDFGPRGFEAIHALARYRGATIGVKYAEAFMLIREVF